MVFTAAIAAIPGIGSPAAILAEAIWERVRGRMQEYADAVAEGLTPDQLEDLAEGTTLLPDPRASCSLDTSYKKILESLIMSQQIFLRHGLCCS